MFSIVLPFRNAAATLRAAVESILAQTSPDWELIAVDDGSTDDGARIVAAYGDPRIRLIQQPNAGPGAARNRGLAEARHDWVAFLDADDRWLPCHLEELGRIREAHPESGMIGTAFRTVASGHNASSADSCPGRIEQIDYLARMGDGRTPFWTGSTAIRRSVYEQLGGFTDHRLGEDSEFWARIALAYPVAASSRVTALYKPGPQSLTSRATARWQGADLRSPADLSPAAALLMERYPSMTDPKTRDAIDRYLDRYTGWCLEASVRLGDVATVRRLRPLYRHRPPLAARLLMGAAALPPPLARGFFLTHRVAGSVVRRLRFP